MGVLETLAAATPHRRTVHVIVDSSLADEHARLTRDLEQAGIDDAALQADHQRALADAAAHDKRHGSLGGPTPKTDALNAEPFDPIPNTTAAADALDAIRDRIKASEVAFVIDPIDWRDRIRLQTEHPPRDKNVVDDRFGYNAETYPTALVRACTVSVTGADGDTVTDIPDATWTHLFGDREADPPVKPALNFGSVNKLTSAAQSVNDGDTGVPPSARSFLGIQDFAASSTPPSPGTSLPDGGEGGSPRTSPTSSTTKKAPSRARSRAT